jgi:hypothetical protein
MLWLKYGNKSSILIILDYLVKVITYFTFLPWCNKFFAICSQSFFLTSSYSGIFAYVLAKLNLPFYNARFTASPNRFIIP